jgi:hypothetical protein
MPKTFSFALHPKSPRVLRIHGSGGQGVSPEKLRQVQEDLGEMYQFVQKTFGGGPFLLMSVLDKMDLALAKEGEMATQGSLAMAQVFNVQRAAYVIDGATLRLQFTRLFRENNLTDRFKAFAKEQDGLEFLLAAPTQ